MKLFSREEYMTRNQDELIRQIDEYVKQSGKEPMIQSKMEMLTARGDLTDKQVLDQMCLFFEEIIPENVKDKILTTIQSKFD
jgi:hypothetical protein